MFDFLKGKDESRTAIIIDVGSGSVGVAIVSSTANKQFPEIIWSFREHVLLKDIKNTQDSLKAIKTAIVNAFLELNSKGLKSLKDSHTNQEIENIQVTISAPWSYTITKTIQYTDEHPFKVEEELVQQLIKTAEKETKTKVDQLELQKQDLKLITDATINININGYNVHKVRGQKGRSLSVSHTSSLGYKSVLELLENSIEKVTPETHTNTYSFMYLFYCMLKNMQPDTSEVCLIDITNEATEVGVVRDGVLKHVTNAPYGTFTLAREIAQAAKIPNEEAFTYLKDGEEFVLNKFTEQTKDQINAIVSAYELKISTLFKTTGDDLSIPKTIFLHTDQNTEEFFKKRIKISAKDATKGQHTIHLITSKLLEDIKTDDTPIALSANFFHNDLHCDIPIE